MYLLWVSFGKKQQEISAEPKAQPRHTPKATENDISLGFTLFSIDEKNLNLECKNCSKVYKFSREIHFSEVSEKGCLTRTTIRCPNCGNVAYDGTNIFLKQLEKSGSVSQQRATDRSQDDTSGSGCLVCLIIVGILVAGGMFLLTDGFSDFALWWLVFPLTFAALILVGMIYGLASSDPKEVKENWDREKYSDYKFTCPMCGSKKSQENWNSK